MRSRSPLSWRRLCVLASVAAAACSTTQSTPVQATSEFAALAPQLSVERFLQYVNARDLDSMGRLFGTAKGPVDWDRSELELQMDLLQRILKHEDYRIVGETQVAGRQQPTRRVGVDLTINGEVIPNVGFDVVQTSEGRWLIQEIDILAITNR